MKRNNAAMPAMMKSMGQPSLETLTHACENPATNEKQNTNQDVSQVRHGGVTSIPRKPRDVHLLTVISKPGERTCQTRLYFWGGFRRSLRTLMVPGNP
jgi:hypothetical protein